MLSTQLEDQIQIDDFVKDKTDREIAMAGLYFFNSHVKECSDRWNKVYRTLKWVGVGVFLIFGDRVANEMPHRIGDLFHDFLSKTLGF